MVIPCYQRHARKYIKSPTMNDLDDLLGLKWNERILNEMETLHI